MELDITKTDRQKSGVNKWRYANGIGTLNWITRFGKTFGALEYIINPHLKSNKSNNVIILVPSEIIANHWKEYIQSYCDDTQRVVIYTASYISVNNITAECSLLVVDELHKFTTPDRKEMLDGTKIKTHYRLGLTGTYPFGIPWIEELYPVVDTVTEEEAIANKWISNFIEYNVLLELPAGDKARYEKFSKPIQETLDLFKIPYPKLTREEGRPIFESEFDLIQACHSGFKTVSLSGQDIYITYDRLCNTVASVMGWHTGLNITIPENEELHKIWSPNAVHTRAKTFIEYIRRRNEILIDNPIKLHAVGDIIANNVAVTICFNESTAFADAVAEYVNARFPGIFRAACYHSKIDSRQMIDPETNDYFKFTTGDRKGLPKILGKDSIKKIVIKGVKDGFYNFLSTAKALDEGLDIPTIEQVICTGGTTNPLTYQQRTARGKTVDIYNPEKVTMIFNLVFDDFVNSAGELIKSRDKTKLILRQKQSGSSIHWVNDISQINFSISE